LRAVAFCSWSEMIVMNFERANCGLPWAAVWHSWIKERAESKTHSDTTVSFDFLFTHIIFFKFVAHIINAGYQVCSSIWSWHILERDIPRLTVNKLTEGVIRVHSGCDPLFRESFLCFKTTFKRIRVLKNVSNQIPANGIQSLIRCSWRNFSYFSLAMCQC
jgi:hypothetical protein